MGASNVSLIYARWAWLPNRAFRVLVYMALVSLDVDDPPRYWAGWEPLAQALGRQVLDHNASEAVRLALLDLVQAGVVDVVVKPRPGRRAEYALRLWQDPGSSRGVRPGISTRPRPGISPASAPGSARPVPRDDPGVDEKSGPEGTHQEESSSRNRVRKAS